MQGYPPPPQYGAPPPYGAPPQQQPAYGRPPYGSQPAFPPQGPQKKSNVGLLVGLGLGGVVLLGAIAGIGVYVAKHMGKGSLPLEANKLPSQTKEIDTMIIDSTRESNDRIKKIYLASDLASAFCSGRSDPANRLETIGEWGSKSAKDFFDPAHLDQVRGQLDCGTQFVSALDDNHASYLTFESEDSSGKDEPKRRHVKIGHFKMKTLPTAEGYTSVSFGTLSGFCQTTMPAYATPLSSLLGTTTGTGSTTPPPPTTKACDDKSNAAFAVGNAWFFSDKAALDELSKSIVVPKTTVGTRVSAIQDAFNATAGLPQVSLVAEPKTSKDYLEYPCEWAASQMGIHFGSYGSSTSGSSGSSGSGSTGSSGITNREEFMQACFPAKQDSKLIEEIDAKLRAIAFETDPEYVKAGAATGNIILVTRDADAAEATERSLKELVGDWKSQLELNAPKLIKAGKDQASSIRQKTFAAVADTYFQALSQMKITRDGRSLKISYKASFTKADRQEMEEQEKSGADKRLPVTEVLEAIRDRKPIPQASLAKLVGNSWATYLLLPPLPPKSASPKVTLTTEECNSIKTRLQSVHMSDLPSTGDSTKAYLDQKYATCDYKKLEVTEDQKKCLATFTNASDYAACMGGDTADPRMPPESEFGDKKK
jgi:hypothetical protein